MSNTDLDIAAGLTSFSATLREHGGEDSDSEEDPVYDVSRDPSKIAMGLKVFKTLPSSSDCQLLMTLYIENHGGKCTRNSLLVLPEKV